MEENKPQGRVNPTNSVPPNPAKKFISWSSVDQCFKYWDKTKGEKGENVLIPLPFTFIPLERAVAYRGYDDDNKISYISNELPELDKGIFTVRGYNAITKKSHVEVSGTYKDISTHLEAKDLKYTESIYIAIKNESGALELANLQLNGAGLMHWFKFIKSIDIWSMAVSVSTFSNEKKGVNKYTAPIFAGVKIKQETDIEAAKFQKQIQEYLKEYYSRSANSSYESQSTSSQPESKPETNTPSTGEQSDSHPAFTGNDFGDDDTLPF